MRPNSPSWSTAVECSDVPSQHGQLPAQQRCSRHQLRSGSSRSATGYMAGCACTDRRGYLSRSYDDCCCGFQAKSAYVGRLHGRLCLDAACSGPKLSSGRAGSQSMLMLIASFAHEHFVVWRSEAWVAKAEDRGLLSEPAWPGAQRRLRGRRAPASGSGTRADDIDPASVYTYCNFYHNF